SSLEKGPSSEKGSMMITAAVLAFHKEFWTTMFPLEALFYQFEPVGIASTLISWHIDSVQQLGAFQEELAQRERALEWSFLAYYGVNV
ncbi:MAG TPA: hypothetical protein VEL31_21415, partial [Ktedonobacteraceae bacterium]|nr:hypothetical protein [Ktedonobacteraceae bacterium]